MLDAKLLWRFFKLLAKQLIKVGPVCKAQFCDDFGNGHFGMDQQPRSPLHGNRSAILKQIHARVFVYDAVEVISRIVQLVGQSVTADSAVGLLHPRCDLGEQSALRFRTQIDGGGGIATTITEMIQDLADESADDVASSGDRRNDDLGQMIQKVVDIVLAFYDVIQRDEIDVAFPLVLMPQKLIAEKLGKLTLIVQKRLLYKEMLQLALQKFFQEVVGKGQIHNAERSGIFFPMTDVPVQQAAASLGIFMARVFNLLVKFSLPHVNQFVSIVLVEGTIQNLPSVLFLCQFGVYIQFRHNHIHPERK